uniref:TFIIS N-terminal domain-containing protein n=1 Tax=Oryza glumipatula TaxID=40148 RepID=A0A0E0B911_9ORYZ
MAAGGEAIPERWKELLVDAIYVAIDDLSARERDTISPELWRRLGDRRAAYKNPFARDGMGSDCSAGEDEVERIKTKLVAVVGEDGGNPRSDPSSEEAVVELLRALQAVPMAFETLEASKIGKAISGLRKHSSEQVRDLAAALYKNWKALVHEHLTRKPPAPPTKTASALGAADQANKANTAAPRKAAGNKHKEAPALPPEMDEAKLEAARKKLRERYRDEETAKKQRKIQVIDAPGKVQQRPTVVERRGVVRRTVASHAPVAAFVRA